jgi:hypothetical protein
MLNNIADKQLAHKKGQFENTCRKQHRNIGVASSTSTCRNSEVPLQATYYVGLNLFNRSNLNLFCCLHGNDQAPASPCAWHRGHLVYLEGAVLCCCHQHLLMARAEGESRDGALVPFQPVSDKQPSKNTVASVAMSSKHKVVPASCQTPCMFAC